MLEHTTESPNADPPPVGPGHAAADTFYTPPGKPEPLNGRGKPPSVKRFNRKALLGLAAVAAIVITLAFAVGLQAPKQKPAPPAESTARLPTPNDSINELPNSYADMAPVLGLPRPGDLPAGTGITAASGASVSPVPPRPLTALEQYAQQQELDRLRREDTARGAGVAFANAEAPSAIASTTANDSTALQEKLLDLAGRSTGASAPSSTPASYREETDANGQESKNQFIKLKREYDFNLHEHVEAPRSPYTLFAGTVLPCVLTQGINSDLPGQIGCMISQNVYDTVTGQHLLVPQGTKAIGTYDSRVAYGQNRVLVVWTRLQRPNGSTLVLEGMPGTDLSGYAGLTGHVNNHYLRLLSGVVLGSLVGASAQIAIGANSQNPSFAALAAQGAGQNINEAGQQITRKNLNIQPTIEVPPGARLNIFASKDLVLPPWTEL